MVLADESAGGQWRVLTGDVFGEEGIAPYFLATVGRDVLVGASAALAAYELPRVACTDFRDDPASGDGLSMALFLGGLVRAAARRFPGEMLQWETAVRGPLPRGSLTALRRAGWLAGIQDAAWREAAPAWWPASLWRGATPTMPVLVLRPQGARLHCAVVAAQGEQPLVLDEQTVPLALADPLVLPGLQGSQGAIRIAQWRYLADESRLSAQGDVPNVMAGEEGCRLVASDGEAIRAAEAAWWLQLLDLGLAQATGLGLSRLCRIVILQDDSRRLSGRFQAQQAKLALRAPGTDVSCLGPAQFAGDSAPRDERLAIDHLLRVTADDDAAAEYVVAAQGSALPCMTRATLFIERQTGAGPRLVVQRRDASRSIAAGMSLPQDVPRQSRLEVTATFLSGGCVVLDASLPAQGWRRQELFGPDAASLTDQQLWQDWSTEDFNF
jgi:hypothetical protein